MSGAGDAFAPTWAERRRRFPGLRLLIPTAGLAPMVVWMALFFVAPMVVMLVYSFWSVEDFQFRREFTLGNYRELLTEPLAYRAFVLSLQLALATTLANVILAFPLAWFLAKRAGRFRLLLVILVILPFWTSFILRGYAWKLLLGDHGILNEGLQFLGLTEQPISAFLYSPLATGIGLVYVFLPLTVLPLYAVLEKMPDSLLEAAADLGAPAWRRFLEVILPAAAPGLAVGGAFTFVFAMGEYVIPQLLGGGKSLLFGQAIVLQIETQQDYASAAAMSMALMLLTLVVVGAVAKLVRIESVV